MRDFWCPERLHSREFPTIVLLQTGDCGRATGYRDLDTAVTISTLGQLAGELKYPAPVNAAEPMPQAEYNANFT